MVRLKNRIYADYALLSGYYPKIRPFFVQHVKKKTFTFENKRKGVTYSSKFDKIEGKYNDILP